jgi:flagellar hook-associated protein 2
VGDSTVQTIRNQIRSMVTSNTTASTDNILALRDVGISINASGKLELNETTLDTAFTSYFSEVVTMLSNDIGTEYVASTDDAGIAGDAINTLTTLLANDGILLTQSTNASDRIDEFELQLEKLEARMTLLLERYNKQFGAMESVVGQSNSLRTSLTSTFDGMMATYTKG